MVVSLLTAYGVILRYGDDYVHNPLFHTAEFEIMLTCSLWFLIQGAPDSCVIITERALI